MLFFTTLLDTPIFSLSILMAVNLARRVALPPIVVTIYFSHFYCFFFQTSQIIKLEVIYLIVGALDKNPVARFLFKLRI